MKRRQTIRRLEIVAIIAVIAVSLGVGLYLALRAGSSEPLNGTLVSSKVYDSLYEAAVGPYGTTSSTYLESVHGITTGSRFTTTGRPIVVFVSAEYCPYCAVQRWSLIMALMRFGNFTHLEYWTSGEDNFATFTFDTSTYQSNYVVLQAYETYDNAGNPLATLPTNYTSAFKQYGSSSYPFLNLNNQYYISGAILNPSVLGTINQTQIISSIQSGGSLGSQIRQSANVITAAICKILPTGKDPSVCSQSTITALMAYTPPSSASGYELLLAGVSFAKSPSTFIAARDYNGWN